VKLALAIQQLKNRGHCPDNNRGRLGASLASASQRMGDHY
jgi:hypothetical protein